MFILHVCHVDRGIQYDNIFHAWKFNVHILNLYMARLVAGCIKILISLI